MAIGCEDQAVLLVDDEPNILFSSRMLLRSAGIREVATLDDSRRVIPLLAERDFGVIVLDLFMPHISGQELLTDICMKYPHIPVLIMTASDELDLAVQCMKNGAHDYLVKPVDKTRFITTIQRTLELRNLRKEVHLLKEQLLSDQLERPEIFAPIITCNSKMRAIFRYMEVVARSRQPILITGETGVGKELFAKAIHQLSDLPGKLVCVNVAGLDDNLFSDSLFGHERGAFTGADRPRAGLISQAGGGTLFLDEIGDLKEASQVKLLRLLQEQEYYPIGSDVPRKSDARIVVATNRNLQQMMTRDLFRSDLYYRLCTHHIHIPPLRERRDDIPFLLDHFMIRASQEFRKKPPAANPELPRLLGTYAFPGNIRELQAMVYDAVARHQSGVLSMESFKNVIGWDQAGTPASGNQEKPDAESLRNLFGRFPTLKEMNLLLVSAAMDLAKGNQGIASSLLGISRQALNQRLKRQEEATEGSAEPL
ncbi:MAG: sigma-54 dependent transcriptional regulator [Syntrophotaleaceae bacterium]